MRTHIVATCTARVASNRLVHSQCSEFGLSVTRRNSNEFDSMTHIGHM